MTAPETRPRPDHAKIARLERELGIGQPSEQGIRPDRTVCLIKDCDGDTEEVRTWAGQLIFRIHQH